MKYKLVNIILIFAILPSFYGCQSVFFDPQKIEYTIYCSSSTAMTTDLDNQEGNDSLRFASASDQGLFVHLNSTRSQNSNASPTKTFTFENQSIELPYSHSKTFITANSTKATLKARSVVDIYSKDRTIMAFRHQTGELIEYSEFDKSIRKASGEYTKEDAEELAIRLFTDLYGEKMLSEYELKSVTEQIDESNSLLCVTYTRYLHGYPTEDELRVKFNRKGELVFLNADYMGYYQHLNKQISKKQIEYAENLLRETISSSWTVEEDVLLVIDANGTCYVRLLASCKDSHGFVIGQDFFINVS